MQRAEYAFGQVSHFSILVDLFEINIERANELLEQMRCQLAMQYLREREMAICEVAYLLGFSESSSFHRAFKRWTGLTPKEFRK